MSDQNPQEHQEHDDPIITTEMKLAGNQIASDLMDACISGISHQSWDAWISQPHKNKDLILSHVSGNIDSVTAIYLAMHRASRNS